MLLVYLRNLGHLLTKIALTVCGHTPAITVLLRLSQIINSRAAWGAQWTLISRDRMNQSRHVYTGAFHKERFYFLIFIYFCKIYLFIIAFFHSPQYHIQFLNKIKQNLKKPPLAHNLPCHKERLLFSCLEYYCFPQQGWEDVFVFNILFGTQIYSIT